MLQQHGTSARQLTVAEFATFPLSTLGLRFSLIHFIDPRQVLKQERKSKSHWGREKDSWNLLAGVENLTRK